MPTIRPMSAAAIPLMIMAQRKTNEELSSPGGRRWPSTFGVTNIVITAEV
jgi:hypothetical protein